MELFFFSRLGLGFIMIKMSSLSTKVSVGEWFTRLPMGQRVPGSNPVERTVFEFMTYSVVVSLFICKFVMVNVKLCLHMLFT